MKTKPVKKTTAPKATAPKLKKCVAAEVGHRRCNCGSPDCGANIGGR